jgi:hypothetical protein
MTGEDPLTLARWLEQGFGVLAHLGCGLWAGLWLINRVVDNTTRYQSYATHLKGELAGLQKLRAVVARCLLVGILIRLFTGADEEVRWFMFWFR